LASHEQCPNALVSVFVRGKTWELALNQMASGFVGSDPTPGATCNIPLMLTGGFSSAAAMNEALQSKAVDVIGLARPLCVVVQNWEFRGNKMKNEITGDTRPGYFC
jgi:2,4-dienoyl-CoA reductase-like NADH-dependent reductase (Old Yellow Enzyme family)